MARAPVVGPEASGNGHLRDPGRTVSAVMGLLGVTFSLVGLVEIALLWFPLSMGDALWEFGTYGGSLDRLPMVALGLGLLGLAAVWHPARSVGAVRAVAVLFVVLGVVLVGVAALYITSVPAALGRMSAQAVLRVENGLLQRAVEAFAYPLAFLGLGWVLWRSVRRPA